ncbi:hypothetical protein HPT25_11920 [Bacillus sp. BRMEA1]|uniref:hypothetical protein n=1 Tax=Neobacillus endophyticus TaxID=2738405 RepID=UPI001565C99A|nr:hypothetical protein [Neobacillus endophyticus]NRD78094.1 hypothetical protein [Neobacillus endophyticus]
MWWKRKSLILSCSAVLLLMFLDPLTQGVRAQQTDTDGFIIEADRVDGTGMTATIVKQETTESTGQPMLRIHYQSATIYGMRLTKQFETGTGMMSISLKANGPVSVKDMTVDTTGISFKGACVNAAQSLPEMGMENVVMVAHFMDTENSVINQLELNTVPGNGGVEKPGSLKILKELSTLPLSQLNQEIGKITSSHFPLMCEDPSKTSDGTGKNSQTGQNIVDVVTKPLGPVTNPLDPILNPLKPVTNPLDPILDPLKPVTNPLDPILDPLKPVTNPFDPILDPLKPVTNPLDPVLKPLEPVTNPLDPILKSLEPVTNPLDPVLKPLDPVTMPLNPILKPQDPVAKPTAPAVNPLGPVANPLDPIVKPVTKPLDPVAAPIIGATNGTSQNSAPPVQSACDKVQDANGVISKELALNLIDEAMEKQIPLDQVCKSNTVLTNELHNWQNSLLKSLGLIDLLGTVITANPVQQLTQIRNQVDKAKSGAILYSP